MAPWGANIDLLTPSLCAKEKLRPQLNAQSVVGNRTPGSHFVLFAICSQYYSSHDRVASHYMSRYRKSLEGICDNFDIELPDKVMPYGKIWQFDLDEQLDLSAGPVG